MNKHIAAAAFLLIFLSSALTAQQVPVSDEDDVVKITSNLVQIDVIVTDRDGNQVTDLTQADFEVLQDGKPQDITNFSYVEAGSDAKSTAHSQVIGSKNNSLPPGRMRATGRGRLITFLVDDGNCRASAVGMRAARAGLEKFITDQMLSDDMVAIYQTRSGSSVFQQYTSDRAQLLRTARKIRWYPPGGSCDNVDGSFDKAARDERASANETIVETGDQRKNRERMEDQNRNDQIVGSLGVLRYAIRGLERVPGRKVMFLMSDGIPFRSRSGEILSANNVLREITDLANRSAVVVNTIDVRGLFDPSMVEARDELMVRDDFFAAAKVAAARGLDSSIAQDGLAFIANETGGTFHRNQNELDVPVRRSLDIEKGFYLLAYEPGSESFKGKKFNKIDVRVKRPELKVIARSGYLGVEDSKAQPKKRSGDSELYEAIVAPLPSAGLNLRLSAFFGNSAAAGNFVRSMVHFQGSEISLVDDTPGTKKAVFDVVAVTMNEKNEVVDEFTRQHTLKVENAAVPLIRTQGIIYSTDVPVKKAGVYNFRVAVRDVNNRLLGSAGQVVEVPDLRKSSIQLSALSVSEVDANGKFLIPEAARPENAFNIPASGAVPAVRRMRRGTVLGYSYSVYNAKLNNARKPDLTIKVNLYYQGELIVEGAPQPAELQAQEDWSRINDFGYMRLAPQMKAGDYALEVIVTDRSASGKNAVSSKWIDFEVVE